jgi:hypothetical protein
MSRWAIKRRKTMMSLFTGSRPSRCLVRVKLVPLPMGAQSGWAPLPWKNIAARVGWPTPAAMAERHMPDSMTLPAPRPRRSERRDRGYFANFMLASMVSSSG